jgi:ribosomal protein S18 acetylase RimI-like enzyme
VRADLPALEWNGEYTHFRRLYLDIYQSAQRGEAILWVAELPEAGLIGQLFVQLKSARKDLADGFLRAYIYGFRLQSLYRRMGLGSYLLSHVESDLLRRGFQITVLNVSRDNVEARQLYERLGYSIVAEEPGKWSYLDEIGNRRWVNEPAWRMEKRIREN